MKKFTFSAVLFAVLLILCSSSFASNQNNGKTAIVLASFGTSYPRALKAITNIEKAVKKSFPGVTVKHAFTSNIIRKIWQKRKNDDSFFRINKGISRDFINIKGPLATIANLQDQGYRTIIVQPTHIFAGEEYADLCSYIDGLNSIRTIKEKFMPFSKLVVGRPALGKPGKKHDYHHDIEKAVKALEKDADEASKQGAALVYMGHGNEYYSTGAYVEFQAEMNKAYPNVRTFVGTVEGYPSLDDVMTGLKHTGTSKVLMKPLMVVAGDHAENDMAGDEDDSWKQVFKKSGIDVKCDVTGLAENDKWAKIYSDLIKDVIKDNKINI